MERFQTVLKAAASQKKNDREKAPGRSEKKKQKHLDIRVLVMADDII